MSAVVRDSLGQGGQLLGWGTDFPTTRIETMDTARYAATCHGKPRHIGQLDELDPPQDLPRSVVPQVETLLPTRNPGASTLPDLDGYLAMPPDPRLLEAVLAGLRRLEPAATGA